MKNNSSHNLIENIQSRITTNSQRFQNLEILPKRL